MNRWTAMSLASALLLACQAPPPAPAAAAPASPLDGAWSLVAFQDVAPDGTTTVSTPQESLLLFSGRHYSMAYVVGDEPAAYYAERFNPTDEESLARMNSMTVNAGTFEVEGSRVTMRPLVARVPEFVGGRAEHEFTVSGDTLTLHWNRTVSADGVEGTAGVTQLTLVRLR